MNAFLQRFVWNRPAVALMAALSILASPAMAAKPPQAQDKSYSVEFLLPATAPNGTQNPRYLDGAVSGDRVIEAPVTVVVYVKNESPPSTAASNIGSLTFDLAPSLVLVANTASVSCPRAQCTVNGNTIVVSNISPPIHGKEVYPIALQVNTCVVAAEAFISNVFAFTGSQVFNGQKFTEFTNDATFQYTTTLSKRDDVYPNQIDFTKAVTPTVTGISCGNISCGQSFTIDNDDPSNLGYRTVTGFRGLDADGTCGASNLSYFVTNKLGVAVDNLFPTTARSVHFVWPSDGTTTPVFAYKVIKDTNATGTALTLGWLPKPSIETVQLDANTVQCNVFYTDTEPTPAQLPLPTAYGVLTQDVKNNTKQLKVDTGGNTPPTVTSAGLAIMVENERMVVTSIDNSGWSVTRTNPAFHAAGKTVASTPFALLGNTVTAPYQSGTPARMCLVWTDGTSAWFIDGSDGGVRIGGF